MASRVQDLWNPFTFLKTLLSRLPDDQATSQIISSTVAIKSIRRSQVTGLLDLTKGHSGHRSQTELMNPFFGPLKWLSKAPKVQKSPPARLARFRQ